MARKVGDCRGMRSANGCSLTIAGEEDEVVRAVTMHAVNVHGRADGPELRGNIRSLLQDGPTVTPVGEPLMCRVMFGIPPLSERVNHGRGRCTFGWSRR
jgi:predicted small metal-binding protein